MPFLKRILETPRYGFTHPNGEFKKPSTSEMWSEFGYRLNVFRDKRNWLTAFAWGMTLVLTIPCLIFLFHYFTLPLFVIGFVYSMVFMGSHGTVWLHRYSTHRAFKIRNPFWIFVVRNLVIKIVPEETYAISHHVHHRYSEQAGDPYNVYGGWLYCFLADATHQQISHDLNEVEYARVSGLLSHTGVRANSFAQYKRWGTVAHPAMTVMHYALNWTFWAGIFYLIGGVPLTMAIFGLACAWAIGIRTFNFEGHGKGKDRRRPGIDFNTDDISVNQAWPGLVAGEWHSNHHLFPSSARSGFLPGQVDLAWIAIKTWSTLGIVTSYRDDKAAFYEKYISKAEAKADATGLTRETPGTLSPQAFEGQR